MPDHQPSAEFAHAHWGTGLFQAMQKLAVVVVTAETTPGRQADRHDYASCINFTTDAHTHAHIHTHRRKSCRSANRELDGGKRGKNEAFSPDLRS